MGTHQNPDEGSDIVKVEVVKSQHPHINLIRMTGVPEEFSNERWGIHELEDLFGECKLPEKMEAVIREDVFAPKPSLANEIKSYLDNRQQEDYDFDPPPPYSFQDPIGGFLDSSEWTKPQVTPNISAVDSGRSNGCEERQKVSQLKRSSKSPKKPSGCTLS